MGKYKKIFILIPILSSFWFVKSYFTKAYAAPGISNVRDNRTSYQNNQIPKFEKFEIEFQLSTQAQNLFFPYDLSPPPGIKPGTGITAYAIFIAPDGRTIKQPAFLYQKFEDQVKNNKEWFYPSNSFIWMVRFSPDIIGSWQFKLVAEDSGGITEAPLQSFSVVDSSSRGFIKTSPRDARYFEYDDGTYFPALGYNLNAGNIDWLNPTLGNEAMFNIMQQNGIQLTRHWFSQWSIFGEPYAKWGSHNRVHQTQEPRTGIVNKLSSQFNNYPGLVPSDPPTGSENYMWFAFDETVSADGTQQRFTPCRYFSSNMAIKQNTNYRVRARFILKNVEGPRVASLPYGFAIKKSSTPLWGASDSDNCYYPGKGSVIAATYNPPTGQSWRVYADPDNPSWSILEGTFNSGAIDFLNYFYLTFDNVKSTDSDNVAGHLFIDYVWIEEDQGGGNYGANLIDKPWMSMHQYINQRDAYAFDKLLDLAERYDIYFKAVMLEKNDRILQSINFNGEQTSNPNGDYFYGNGRVVTKVRWLQQAWWRYMQARWGYSPNIHSWELLNEGDPVSTNHWILADEFGKYMKCRVFDIDPGQNCFYEHPNAHMVTTSFWGSAYTTRFWGDNINYPDVDYADRHLYAEESSGNPSFFDSAQFSLDSSYQIGAYQSIGPKKPVMRGEVAWGFIGANLLENNADGGDWLHDFIWAGINSGGLIEHFFAGGHFTRQIYYFPKTGASHDHRHMFGAYFRFIKDIPLNNGRYVEAEPQVSDSRIRVLGQKDLTAGNAHLWIQNKNHTWKNVVDNVTIEPLNGTVKVSGFVPDRAYKTEWWDTNTGTIALTQDTISDSSGNLTFQISNLIDDIAVKIGDYKLGDANGDGRVDGLDYVVWLTKYGGTTVNKERDGDFNADGRSDGIDYTIWLNNYGRVF